MTDVTPRAPQRPLLWHDIVYELQDLLAEHQFPLYIVGGAVRDAYLHRPLKDLDLVTAGDALALARYIANSLHGDYYPLDSQRGVGRALIETDMGRLTIDVARFRGDDLLADLTDRDFTLNAMAVDLHGDLNLLIDPLGGERDIATKFLRRCASHALVNDPVRTLRAVRQSAQLGVRIETETLRDVRTNAAGLANVSAERLRDELFNIFALPKPAPAIRVLEMLGFLPYVTPEYDIFEAARRENTWSTRVVAVEKLTDLFLALSPARTDDTAASFDLGIIVMQLDRFRAKIQAHLAEVWANGRLQRALLILAALLNRDEHSEAVAQALRLSNDEAKRLKRIAKYTLPEGQLTPLVIHHFWREAGVAGIDICLLSLVKHLATAGTALDQDTWLQLVDRVRILLSAYFEQYARLVEPPLLVDGNQLMEELALEPGKQIKRLLDAIREAQVLGEVQSAEDALRLARELLNHT